MPMNGMNQPQPIFNQPQTSGNAMDLFRTQMRSQLGFPPSLPSGTANPSPASPMVPYSGPGPHLGGQQPFGGRFPANSPMGPYGGPGGSSTGMMESGMDGGMSHAPALGMPPHSGFGPHLGGQQPFGGFGGGHPLLSLNGTPNTVSHGNGFPILGRY